MIALIDYGMGNLRSVQKALEKAGAYDIKVTSEPSDIESADKIVMPGVGAMGEAMQELGRRALIEAIKQNIFRKPYLGICLGLQLLFKDSEEGNVSGLGVLEGRVKRFTQEQKVPHMGWNSISFSAKTQGKQGEDQNQKSRNNGCAILKDIPNNSYFYFCHSYYVAPEDAGIIAATTEYAGEFASLIAKDNLFAMQFHPEKSQALGLKILENFVNI